MRATPNHALIDEVEEKDGTVLPLFAFQVKPCVFAFGSMVDVTIIEETTKRWEKHGR